MANGSACAFPLTKNASDTVRKALEPLQRLNRLPAPLVDFLQNGNCSTLTTAQKTELEIMGMHFSEKSLPHPHLVASMNGNRELALLHSLQTTLDDARELALKGKPSESVEMYELAARGAIPPSIDAKALFQAELNWCIEQAQKASSHTTLPSLGGKKPIPLIGAFLNGIKIRAAARQKARLYSVAANICYLAGKHEERANYALRASKFYQLAGNPFMTFLSDPTPFLAKLNQLLPK